MAQTNFSLYIFSFEQLILLNRLSKLNFLDEAKETINKVEKKEGKKIKNNADKIIKEIQNLIVIYQEIKRKAIINSVKNKAILFSMKYSFLENYSKDYNIINIYNNICQNIIDSDIKFYVNNEKQIINLMDNINQIRLNFNI